MKETSLLPKAQKILKTLQDKNFEIYFCGSCIRDSLVGREIKGIDIATSATPDEVEAIFGKDRTVQCGKNFLVCRVKEGDKEPP